MSKFTICLLCIISAVLYAVSVNAPAPAFVGTDILNWSRLDNFSRKAKSSETPVKFIGINSKPNRSASAVSEKFTCRSEILSLEVLGVHLRKAQSAVEVYSDKDVLLSRHQFLYLEKKPGDSDLTRVELELPEAVVGSSIYLKVFVEKSTDPDLFIRDRVEFLRRDTGSRFSSALGHSEITWLVLSFFAALLVILAVASCWPARALPLSQFVLILSAASLLLALRTGVYFYWDEWEVLIRFQLYGLKGVIYTHNEHFLPVFWVFLYLQYLLFDDWYHGYLLVSLALHIANATLLSQLLQRWGSRIGITPGRSQVISLFYLLNALHSSNLQWAFLQCVLLLQTIVFISMLSVEHYLRTSNKWSLLAVFLSVLTAPLVFGNGFILIPLLFLSLGLSYINQVSSVRQELCRNLKHLLFTKKCLTLICSLLFGLSLTALIYYANRHGAGHDLSHGVMQWKPWENLSKLLGYIGVGTQFGVVFRGSGLFPSLSPYGAGILEPINFLNDVLPEVFAALIGSLISLIILAASLSFARSEQRKAYDILAYWLLGQGYMVLCFILPAIARFQFGVSQALSLRYQSPALVGLIIIALPLITWLWEGNRIKQGFLTLSAFVYLWSNLYSSACFRDYLIRGEINRRYVSMLAQWKSTHDLSELRGQMPYYPPILSPSFSAERVSALFLSNT